MKFKDLKFNPPDDPSNPITSIQAKTFFPNGYGISVIQGPRTHGGVESLWELAVLKGTENTSELCYETPITDDVIGHLGEIINGVIGHLSEEEVVELIDRVSNLPEEN